MKINLVARSFDPTRGGHEKYLNRLTDEFLDRGHDITVISERFGNTRPEQSNLHFKETTAFKLESGFRKLWFNWSARRAVKNHDGDLTFVTGDTTFGDLFRAGGGVHRTYMEQCVPPLAQWKPKHLVKLWMQRKMLDEAPYPTVIVNSKMVRDDMLKRFEIPPEKIEVIYNGVDTDTYDWETLGPRRDQIRSDLGLSDDDFACLFTAGSWKRKGLPLVLETFAKLTDPSIKLFVVGHTKKNRLVDFIEEHNLENQVFYEGYVENIEDYYAACDTLVFPSRYDAGASVVPEALASGLPVITSRWNGTHELVDEGENGFVLADVDSSSELKSLIQKARKLEQEKVRENAWRKGSTFTMKRHFTKILEVHQSV